MDETSLSFRKTLENKRSIPQTRAIRKKRERMVFMSSKYWLILGAVLLASLSGCNEASSEVTVQRPSPRANPSIRPVNNRPLPEPYATGSGSSGVRGHDFCEWKDREHG